MSDPVLKLSLYIGFKLVVVRIGYGQGLAKVVIRQCAPLFNLSQESSHQSNVYLSKNISPIRAEYSIFLAST